MDDDQPRYFLNWGRAKTRKEWYLRPRWKHGTWAFGVQIVLIPNFEFAVFVGPLLLLGGRQLVAITTHTYVGDGTKDREIEVPLCNHRLIVKNRIQHGIIHFGEEKPE